MLFRNGINFVTEKGEGWTAVLWSSKYLIAGFIFEMWIEKWILFGEYLIAVEYFAKLKNLKPWFIR